MNNIRKIIEERLENARNDYKYYQEGSNEFYEYGLFEISGQIEAYQDCLNLMQPRTEADILNEFEKLGYKIKVNNASMLYLTNDYDITIHINKLIKGYRRFYDNEISNYITIQEHKLLNELFICWGWI